MTEAEIKAIEEQMRLREKKLALDEKDRVLRERKWRVTGGIWWNGFVMIFCVALIGLGGCNFWKLTNDASQSTNGGRGFLFAALFAPIAKNNKQQEQKSSGASPSVSSEPSDQEKADPEAKDREGARQWERIINSSPYNNQHQGPLVVNSVHSVSQHNQKEAGKNGEFEQKASESFRQWPLVVALLMNGFFILAGLGVAALTARAFIRPRGEED
ncbi:MAG: hypothetical protein LBU39_03720 [Desulfobulbaceae bacterium]|jgi:hypothetical protein|nr:hypothetical protein [Desulfobulbaceae bacterium]